MAFVWYVSRIRKWVRTGHTSSGNVFRTLKWQNNGLEWSSAIGMGCDERWTQLDRQKRALSSIAWTIRLVTVNVDKNTDLVPKTWHDRGRAETTWVAQRNSWNGFIGASALRFSTLAQEYQKPSFPLHDISVLWLSLNDISIKRRLVSHVEQLFWKQNKVSILSCRLAQE